jgi:hypothetical protein
VEKKQKQSEAVDPSLVLLAKIESHLGALLRVQLGPVYDSLVSTTDLKKLYQATGNKSVAALAKEFGMSTGKISMLWQKWEKAGLLTKIGQHYEKTI